MLSSSAPHSKGLLAALRLFCWLLIGLHLLAPALPEALAWGLWPYAYLPPGWRWGLALLAAACTLPAASRLAGRLAAVWRPLRRVPRHALFAALAALAILPFALLRIVHTRWGDAYILVNAIAHPDPALRLTATWQAPLDVWLHARVWLWGNRLFGWSDAWPAYRLLSPLAGALFLYTLLRLADSIGRDRTEKLLIVGLMGTLGLVQLFFGYAENYVLAAAGVLLFLWLTLETLRGRRPPWQPALALAVTNGLHPSTVALAPALLYVGWVWSCQSQESRRKGPTGALAQIVAPLAAVAGAVIVLMTLSGHGLETLLTTDRPGGGDARWLVPLSEVTTRWERYTLFSWPHLLDFLNEQTLTAPVTLGGLLLTGAALPGRRRAGPGLATPKSEIIFLVLGAGLYGLFTWVWNPDYGGQRDWDLFSLAALPSTLLLARLLPRALPDRSQLAQAGLMLTAVSAMHTAAWIYQNTRPWEWP